MTARRRHLAVLAAALLAAAPAAVGGDGTISTFAGTVAGFAGDGDRADLALLNRPEGMGIQADGSVLIADTGNNRIRRVAPDGRIFTIAGDGTAALAGDGGPAINAQLNAPTDVVVLGDGTILIADSGNHRIRRIAPGGTITTLAGTVRGLAGDGGAATLARLDTPTELAPLADGGLLVADTGNHRIRKITGDGTISTVAGTVRGFSGDGGPATAAALDTPRGVAVSADGGFLVADAGNRRVRKVAPDGTITTVAGGGVGFDAEGGPASAAALGSPADVAPLGRGLVVVDAGTDRVRRITPLGAVFTVAGGRRGLAGDGGPAQGGQLDSPQAFTFRGTGLLVGDTGNSRVRLVSDTGEVPPPEPLRTIRVTPGGGTVTVRPRGGPSAIAVQEPDLAPNASRVDATGGTIGLTVRDPDGGPDATAEASLGSFLMVQPIADTAIADLRLDAPLNCGTAARATGELAAKKKKRRLRIKVKGRYRTSGRYAVAVANGTAWEITDFCDRTTIRVTEGTVTVRDLRLRRNVRVRAGRTYVALARAPRRR
ncbi:MAG: hypothetical protein IT200_07260 [Thermoleophilia bacterium]|nr:hypothetical protein [Thermoleophilia bacterium]